MLGQQFYHETVRNVIVAFGTMFNNINIVRKDNSGTIIQSMKVPLAYGPKQKFLTRLDQDPSLSSATAITLPRLGFEIGSLTYDTARKMNRVQKFKKVKSSSSNAGDTITLESGVDSTGKTVLFYNRAESNFTLSAINETSGSDAVVRVEEVAHVNPF